MKRSELRRKAPIQRAQRARTSIRQTVTPVGAKPPLVEKECLVCGLGFKVKVTKAANAKTCGKRECKAAYKKTRVIVRPMSDGTPAQKERWRAAIKPYCENPDCLNRFAPGRQQHHCVYYQHIRRMSGDCWDPRNSLTLCDTCHERHHKRVGAILLIALPQSVFEFAVELMGFGAAYEYLRRRYRGDDPRLDLLLEEDPAVHPTIYSGER